MKSVIFAVGLMLLCGCRSSSCLFSEKAEPVKGEKYELKTRIMQVVQVCDGSVHAMLRSRNGLRICVIPIVNDYVTDSYLRPGLYEYMGPYTYETPVDLAGNRHTNTIRLFKEVKGDDL